MTVARPEWTTSAPMLEAKVLASNESIDTATLLNPLHTDPLVVACQVTVSHMSPEESR